jgi:hypothetical protein
MNRLAVSALVASPFRSIIARSAAQPLCLRSGQIMAYPPSTAATVLPHASHSHTDFESFEHDLEPTLNKSGRVVKRKHRKKKGRDVNTHFR